jgi:LL-diaminopimelate aminotransferase
MDSSIFLPIQEAGMAALNGDQSWLVERNAIYQERRDIVVDALRKAGFTIEMPKAAIYVWAMLPDGNADSMSFCSRLLDETGVSTTPGVVYGQYGEGYLRISLGTATDRIQEAVARIAKWVH